MCLVRGSRPPPVESKMRWHYRPFRAGRPAFPAKMERHDFIEALARAGVLNFRSSRVASRRRAGESNDRQGEDHLNNVIIIGSGCSGLTAAIYAGRANLKPVVIDGFEPGGQLSLTTMVENFPGFPDGILGPELIENMRKQAQRFGAEFRAGAVSSVDLSKRPFKIATGNDVFETQALIIASGASARMM